MEFPTVLMGGINVALGRPERARSLFERALRSSPDLTHAQVWLAHLDWQRGRHREARARVGEIRRLSPDLTADHILESSTGPLPTEDLVASLRAAGHWDAPASEVP